MPNIIDGKAISAKTKEELTQMIKDEISKNKNKCSLNHIDVSKITDMSSLFYGYNFNVDISDWDVSNVTDMRYMFAGCESFNQPLDKWNVSNVIYMNHKFNECEKFNQDISNWNVSNVADNYYMLEDCPIEEKYKPKFK